MRQTEAGVAEGIDPTELDDSSASPNGQMRGCPYLSCLDQFRHMRSRLKFAAWRRRDVPGQLRLPSGMARVRLSGFLVSSVVLLPLLTVK